MQIIRLNELESKDVFEFMVGDELIGHWNSTSIFLTEESFSYIFPLFNENIDDFNYYGPNKITIEQWNIIKTSAETSFTQNDLKKQLMEFVSKIDDWATQSLKNYSCFLVCGP